MTNTVGPLGLQAIARGSLFPEFPSIFPTAEAIKRGSSIELINLIGTRNLNFVAAQPHPIFAYANAVTLIGFATAAMVAKYSYLAAITSLFLTAVYRLLEQTAIKPSTNTIYLKPEPTRKFPSITYEESLDAIVQGALVDSEMVTELDKAFREYRLNVFGAVELGIKIKEIVERSLRVPPAPITEVSFLREAESLFAKSPDNVLMGAGKAVFFFGPSGAGKTTIANCLLGGKMKAVNPLFFKRPVTEEEQKIIIAEESLAEIGHKVGANSSQTFYPKIFKDQKNELIYCDCPGGDDNRTVPIAICNAQTIVKTLREYVEIQCFLFFIDYNDLKAGRGDKFFRNLKLFQLLLREFKFFSNNVFFIITKTNSSTRLSGVREMLNLLISTVIANKDQDQDAALQKFCKEIKDARALETKVFLFDPIDGGKDRMEMLDRIKACPPISHRFRTYGYPLTPEVLRKLEEARHNAKENLVNVLADLKAALYAHWAKMIAESETPQKLKTCYFQLRQITQDVLTLDKAISYSKTTYSEISNRLKAEFEEWGMADLLLNNKQNLPPLLQGAFREIHNEITSLMEQAEKLYYSKTSEPLESRGGCILL